MGKIIKGFNIFIAIALVTLALVVAFIALPVFGNQALIVRSGSMTPTINVGSIIVVRPKTKIISPINTTPSYQKGDIIAFRSEKNSNTIITHRITSYEMFNATVFYKTKGDANEEEDNWTVDEKQILGKSFVTIPQAGKVLAFAKSKYGFPALIILPSLIVIILEAINIIKELKKHKRTTIEESIEPKSSPTFFINFKPLKVIIPILAAGLLIPFALAFYGDTETFSGNVLQAAAVFPTISIATDATPTGTQPTPTGQTLPTGSGLVINEVSPVGTAAAEWIELFNPTGSSIDVSGWTIADGNNSDIIPSTPVIPSGGYAVIITSTSIVNGIPGSAVIIQLDNSQIGSGLNDTGDFVEIRNLSNASIDNISYGNNTTAFSSPPSIPGGGNTLSRSPNGIDTNLSADWINTSASTLGISN